MFEADFDVMNILSSVKRLYIMQKIVFKKY